MIRQKHEDWNHDAVLSKKDYIIIARFMFIHNSTTCTPHVSLLISGLSSLPGLNSIQFLLHVYTQFKVHVTSSTYRVLVSRACPAWNSFIYPMHTECLFQLSDIGWGSWLLLYVLHTHTHTHTAYTHCIHTRTHTHTHTHTYTHTHTLSPAFVISFDHWRSRAVLQL